MFIHEYWDISARYKHDRHDQIIAAQFQERADAREGTVFLPDNENRLWGFIGRPIKGSLTVIYSGLKK